MQKSLHYEEKNITEKTSKKVENSKRIEICESDTKNNIKKQVLQ